MDIIIKDTTFNTDKIKLKQGKKCLKILYDLKSVLVIGLSFQINNYTYQENNNFLLVDMVNSPQLQLLKRVDEYFQLYFTNYQSFIINDKIKIKKNNNYHPIDEDNLYISLNNLKKFNSLFKVQIYTI